MKIKVLLLALAACMCVSTDVHGVVTRNQLIGMLHKANKARNQHRYDEAINYFMDVIKVAPKYSEPYFRIGRMYDEMANSDPKYKEKAVIFYRKFIEIELDDKKTTMARSRLNALEKELLINHFETELIAQAQQVEEEYSQLDQEVETELTAEAAAPEPEHVSAPEPETVMLAIADEEESAEVDQSVLAEVPVAATPVVAADVAVVTAAPSPFDDCETDEDMDFEFAEGDPLAMPLSAVQAAAPQTEAPVYVPAEIITSSSNAVFRLVEPITVMPGRTRTEVTKIMHLTPGDICGRWVSDSRLPNGREVWLLDITSDGQTTTVTPTFNAGVSKASVWADNGAPGFAPGSGDGLIGSDVNLEVLKLVTSVKPDETAPSKFNGYAFESKFTLDMKNDENAGGGVKKLLSNGFKTLTNGGGWRDLKSLVQDGDELNETPIRTYATVSFDLHPTETGLAGNGREQVFVETSSGVKQRANRYFPVTFHKVSSTYPGFEVQVSPYKTEARMTEESTALRSIEADAARSDEAKYMVGYLQSLSVGENTFTPDDKKVYKSMMKAAKQNNPAAMRYLVVDGYAKAADNTLTKAERKKQLEIAETWADKLMPVDSAAVLCARARYAIETENNYEDAMKMYSRASSAEALMGAARIIVETNGKTDNVIKLLTKAAELGDPDALLYIARMYRDGNGVEEDAGEYIRYTVKALEAGSMDAAGELAYAYSNGIGVEPNQAVSLAYVKMHDKLRRELWKREVRNYYKSKQAKK